MHHLRSDCSCKLDQVTSRDIVASKEGRERVNGIIDTVVSREVDFDVSEEHHGSVCSSALQLTRPRETDGVVEGET